MKITVEIEVESDTVKAWKRWKEHAESLRHHIRVARRSRGCPTKRGEWEAKRDEIRRSLIWGVRYWPSDQVVDFVLWLDKHFKIGNHR